MCLVVVSGRWLDNVLTVVACSGVDLYVWVID